MSQGNKNLPEGWIETTIGTLVDLAQGVAINAKTNHVLSDKENGIPLLKINNLLNNTVDQYANPDLVPKQSIIHKEDVIFTRTGQVGEVLKNKYGILHNNSFKVIPNDKLYWNFLYWYLKSEKVYNYVQKVAAGSVQKDLNHSAFKTIEFKYPINLKEQKSIANVLTAFDGKIENLRAQNDTLEQTAQTIFTEWFGKYQLEDELPDGWRIGKIGNLTEIKRGGSPRPIKDYISDSGYRWLKISDATATESPYIFNIKEHIRIEGLSKTTLKKEGSLVLSNSATPGMPKILAVDTCIHDGWMHFPSSIVSNEYLYLLFTNIRPRLVQQGSGSVFVNLKTDILRYFETVLPPNEVLMDFDAIIQPIFKKILTNSEQIQSLSQTRDTLLPQLMSGQLRVKNVETLELAVK
ncbi:restriction endonuclease subunit S [Gelidibacter mesophilus]|uniref:restriction endonuclease subunit S n=1 Tax=Gelidibacter mesophilus TaxID=169050 RepID=UPI000428AA96|nr:restriction endonuclease subunit S [Gelidibacter mesophilus]